MFTTRFGIARPQLSSHVNNLNMNAFVDSKKTQTWSNELVFPIDESKKSSNNASSISRSNSQPEISKFPMERIKHYLQKELKMDPLNYTAFKPKSPTKIVGFDIPEDSKQQWIQEKKNEKQIHQKSLLQGINERIKKTNEANRTRWI